MWSRALLHLFILVMANRSVVLPQTTGNPGATSDLPTATANTAAPQTNNWNCPENSGMMESTRQKVDITHNYRRGRLARGEVPNEAGKNLSAAANMLRMEYNCALEASAAKTARRCSLMNTPNLPSDVQENIYSFEKSQANTQADALVVAVKHWWSQVRVTGGIGQDVTYTQAIDGQPTKWFTKMAWATTQHMGCAVVSCSLYWNVVCHYQTGGNRLGEEIYSVGKACSACPPDTFCNGDKLCQLHSAV